MNLCTLRCINWINSASSILCGQVYAACHHSLVHHSASLRGRCYVSPSDKASRTKQSHHHIERTPGFHHNLVNIQLCMAFDKIRLNLVGHSLCHIRALPCKYFGRRVFRCCCTLRTRVPCRLLQLQCYKTHLLYSRYHKAICVLTFFLMPRINVSQK